VVINNSFAVKSGTVSVPTGFFDVAGFGLDR
jgi:hypothetical protein